MPDVDSRSGLLLDVIRRRWLHISLLLLLLLAMAPTPAPLRLIREMQNAENAAHAGQYAEALEHIAHALALEPQMTGLYEPAFNLAVRIEDLSAAQTYLTAMRNTQSNSTDLECLKLDLLMAEQAYESALTHTRQRALNCPQAVPVLEKLAGIAQEQMDRAQEETALQLLQDISPKPQMAMRLGLLQAVHDPIAARNTLKAAGALQADGPALVRELFQAMENTIPEGLPAFTFAQNGMILASHKQWQLAVDAFTHAVELEPEYVDAHAYLGLSLDQAGRDGLKNLQEAIRLEWSHSLAHLFLGMHWLNQGNLPDAQAEFALANRFDPQNPTILAQMAAATSYEGDTEQALVLYQRAAESAPEDQNFWLLLAQFSLSQEVRVTDIGVPAARKALVADPQSASANDALGYGYYLLNQPELAERFLLQAIALDPSLASAQYHAGMLWIQKQELNKARDAFQRAFELDPDGVIGQSAQSALRDGGN